MLQGRLCHSKNQRALRIRDAAILKKRSAGSADLFFDFYYICGVLNTDNMKRIILTFAAALLCTLSAFAQNDKGDNILGRYSCDNGKDSYKVEITKQKDGTYTGRIYWVAEAVDKNGKPVLDAKNPDKSLRTVPMDKVVLFAGLKYSADKKHWSGTKIYDPTRGIKASVTINFDDPKTLKVRGTVLGIGETETWKRL